MPKAFFVNVANKLIRSLSRNLRSLCSEWFVDKQE